MTPSHVQTVAGLPICHPGLEPGDISEGFFSTLASTQDHNASSPYPYALSALSFKPQCVSLGLDLSHNPYLSCSMASLPLKPFRNLSVQYVHISFSSHSYEDYPQMVVSSALSAMGPAPLTGVSPTPLQVNRIF